MINIKKSDILANNDDILNLELIIKSKYNKDIKIPQDYINFLLKYNGCNFESETIKYIYFKPEIELSIFVSVKDLIEYLSDPYKTDFEGYYLDALINDLILTRIGYEKWGGDEISIGIGKKNNGHIYISKLYSAIDFEKIADSFTEFLNGLVIFDDDI